MSTNVGRVMVPRQGTRLRSGACTYNFAVCVNENPLILVSEQADMIWAHSGFTVDQFYVGPEVSQRTLERVMTRFSKEKSLIFE